MLPSLRAKKDNNAVAAAAIFAVGRRERARAEEKVGRPFATLSSSQSQLERLCLGALGGKKC